MPRFACLNNKINNKISTNNIFKSFYPYLVGAFAVIPLLISGTVLGIIESGTWSLDTDSMLHLALFFAGAACGMAAALIPTTFVAILSGYYWGWAGFGGVLISYPIAAVLGLYIGRFLFAKTGQRLLNNPKYQKLLTGLEDRPLAMLIFARLSPVLPFAMSNLLLGQLRLPMGTYLLGTIIGMLPRTVFFFFLGTQAKEILAIIRNPHANQKAQLLTIVLLVVSVVGLFWVGRRVWKRVYSPEK